MDKASQPRHRLRNALIALYGAAAINPIAAAPYNAMSAFLSLCRGWLALSIPFQSIKGLTAFRMRVRQHSLLRPEMGKFRASRRFSIRLAYRNPRAAASG